MNAPSPFIPQGSFLERKRLQNRSKLKMVVFIVLGFHVAVLVVVLIQGCRHSQEKDASVTPLALSNSTAGSSSLPANAPTPAESTFTNPPTIALPVPSQVSELPVMTETAAPTQPTTTKDYRVVKGDTLGRIAKRQGVFLNVLKQANPGVDPTKLQFGQMLHVPESPQMLSPSNAALPTSQESAHGERIYVVKSGDTLLKIAHVHGTTAKAIRDFNHLRSDRLIVGRKLKLPSQTTSPEKPSALNTTSTNSLAR